MMRKRRWICLLILFFLTAVFFAARNSERKSEDQKSVQVAISFCDTSNARTTAIWEDVLNNMEESKISVEWRNAKADIEKQRKDIEALLAYKPKYLVVMPVQTRGIEEVLLQASAQKTKIILLDRTLDNYKDIPILAEIRSDATWEGQACADLLARHFNGKPGNILEISGEKGTSINKMHSTGFRNRLQEFENLEIAGNVEGNGERGTARSSVITYLMNNPDTVNAIFANTDEEGIGAIAALEELGLKGQIPVVSINGIDDVRNAMAAGGYYGCVEASPYLGELLTKLIADAEAGKQIDAEHIIKGTVYTVENLEQMQGY